MNILASVFSGHVDFKTLALRPKSNTSLLYSMRKTVCKQYYFQMQSIQKTAL